MPIRDVSHFLVENVSLSNIYMNIVFEPCNNEPRFTESVAQYSRIWEVIRTRLIDSVDLRLGLEFSSENIICIVGDEMSHSGNSDSDPMSLRFNYSDNQKMGFLIHELCHRVLFEAKIDLIYADCHYLVCPILFDLYHDVMGPKLASSQIKYEMQLNQRYQKAWNRTLSFDTNNLRFIYMGDLSFLQHENSAILHASTQEQPNLS